MISLGLEKQKSLQLWFEVCEVDSQCKSPNSTFHDIHYCYKSHFTHQIVESGQTPHQSDLEHVVQNPPAIL